jgi:two-component system, NtrC family, response regulator AtoC
MERPDGIRIVIADDHQILRAGLKSVLQAEPGFAVVGEAGDGAEAVRLARALKPDVLLIDLAMPGTPGMETLAELAAGPTPVRAIVFTTAIERPDVVKALRLGAAGVLLKESTTEMLFKSIRSVAAGQHWIGREMVTDLVEALRGDPPEPPLPEIAEKQALKSEVLTGRLDRRDRTPDFVSASPGILRIKRIARQVADTDAPVLLLGESGVGKDVVARFIHSQSRRRGQSLVRINCAALPQELLESELFGYERGAFSGALREKPGMFELAHNGSILLDEIGEMSPHLQAKLLHVLQDGEYTRLGGRQPVRADARVLASTNARLDEAVAAGRFREDLYFRLNVIRIEIPPLRERRDDVPLLAGHFLKAYAARYNSPVRELPRELSAAFLRYDWPGNIRELENAVRRYVILPDLEMALTELHRAADDAPRELGGEALLTADLSLKEVGAQAAEEAERRLLRRVLDETRWNRKQAASQLKISYKALLNKLKKWEELGVREEPVRFGRAVPSSRTAAARRAVAVVNEMKLGREPKASGA